MFRLYFATIQNILKFKLHSTTRKKLRIPGINVPTILEYAVILHSEYLIIRVLLAFLGFNKWSKHFLEGCESSHFRCVDFPYSGSFKVCLPKIGKMGRI